MLAQVLNGSLTEPTKRVLERTVEFLPNIIAAVALILIGWIVAWLLRVASVRICRFALDRLKRTRFFEAKLRESVTFESLPALLGSFVFWITLLFFVAAGIEALGLPAISKVLSSATTYLPRVLLAVVIVFGGFVLGDLARGWLVGALARTTPGFAGLIARSAQVIIVVVGIMVAIDHLGIDSTVVVIIAAICVGSAFGAGALAFGLGAGGTVSNIIAAHYVQKAYRIGNTVRIGDLQGTIREISRTAVVLETPEGRVQVPARRFNEEVSVLIQEEERREDS